MVHIADWYPTILNLAGLGDIAADNASFSGIYHDIDGVNVWPLLTGSNTTVPRNLTPTSEVGILDSSDEGHLWKLVTLAGQSNYYFKNQTNYVPANASLRCLDGRQDDPSEPGRTDPIVNGACPVCNATMPCLFDLLADPNEEQNLANKHPDIVARLSASVKQFQDYYPGIGRLSESEIARYEKIDDPNKHWGGFDGPCYLNKKHHTCSGLLMLVCRTCVQCPIVWCFSQ